MNRNDAEPNLADRLDRALSALRAGDDSPLRGIVDTHVPTPLAAPGSAFDPEIPPGTRFGRYRILRPLGRGGMGTVYEAEQDEPRRVVALKVLRAGLVSNALQLRLFKREAEVLARVIRCGTAQVLEAGTVDGRPFIAMEHVVGEPLDRWAVRAGRTRSAILDLFLRLADGVHDAHRCGVVHRDLKPSNVIVDEDDAPRVLDFGLARLVGGDDESIAIGCAGTLPWMSPEQVTGSCAIDVRSDVYGLGLVLYRLLTGRHPYDVDVENLADATATIADSPPTPPRRHVPDLELDLQAIVLMALEKDPDRRYESAAALADDIRRHLEHAPIVARRLSAIGRMARLCRRHRTASTAAFTVVMIGLLALIVTRRTGRRADAFERRTASLETQLQTRVRQADPEVAHAPDYRDIEQLRLSFAQFDAEHHADPVFEADMLSDFARSFMNFGRPLDARRMFERAYALRRERFGERSHPDLAQSLRDLGFIFHVLEDLESSEQLKRAALDMRRELFGDSHDDTLQSYDEVADILMARHDVDGALLMQRRAVAAVREHRRDDAICLATTLTWLGKRLRHCDRHDEAVAVHEEAFELLVAHDLAKSAIAARVLVEWAEEMRVRDLGRAEEMLLDAERIQSSVNADLMDLAWTLNRLGVMWLDRRNTAGAVLALERSLQMLRTMVGDDHHRTADARALLCDVRLMRGELEPAERLVVQALASLTRIYGDQHTIRVMHLCRLANIRRKQGRLADAELVLVEAYKLAFRTPGPGHRKLFGVLGEWATVRWMGGDRAGGVRFATERLALARRLADQRETIGALRQVGQLLRKSRRPMEALEFVDEALALARSRDTLDAHIIPNLEKLRDACRAALSVDEQ